MSQAQWLVLALKVALIAGFISLLAWVILYSVLSDWWTSPIGRTLVAKTTLIACTFLVIVMPTFFPWFTRHPLVTGWIDFTLIALVSPTMWWRSLVWVKLHRAGKLHQDGSDGDGEGQA